MILMERSKKIIQKETGVSHDRTSSSAFNLFKIPFRLCFSSNIYWWMRDSPEKIEKYFWIILRCVNNPWARENILERENSSTNILRNGTLILSVFSLYLWPLVYIYVYVEVYVKIVAWKSRLLLGWYTPTSIHIQKMLGRKRLQ